MMLRTTLYHKCLRVSAVLFALTLLFQSSLLGTRMLAYSTERFMANTIGMSAVIEENELNTITRDLTAQRRALDAREREINARAVDTTGSALSDFIMSGVLLLLLLLIVLNYLFDYLRARAQLRTYAKMA